MRVAMTDLRPHAFGPESQSQSDDSQGHHGCQWQNAAADSSRKLFHKHCWQLSHQSQLQHAVAASTGSSAAQHRTAAAGFEDTAQDCCRSAAKLGCSVTLPLLLLYH